MSDMAQIQQSIRQGNNFVLNGGAGSGKTYTLIETLKHIHQVEPLASVACITFTNVAVDEIKERVPTDGKLVVSTIHDFLWSQISNFQINLKETLVHLLNQKQKYFQYSGNLTLDNNHFKNIEITYRDQYNFAEGVVSHDQILPLAEAMFANYKLLSDIFKDKYSYILVDEYQDTAHDALIILLKHLEKSKKSIVVGLFGDEMQAIYKDEGDIHAGRQLIKKSCQSIFKADNRRNPEKVIELINQLRLDGLEQKGLADINSPNNGQVGCIQFIYSNEIYEIGQIKKLKIFDDWNFDDPDKTKELYLTKKLIAKEVGFPQLMNIYANDRIISYKRCVVKKIREAGLEVDENMKFGEAIKLADISPKPIENKFILEHRELYEFAKKLPYKAIYKTYLKVDQLIGSNKKSQQQSSSSRDERDDLIKHLLDIQECIDLYQGKQYNEFIKKTDYRIRYISDKRKLLASIELICGMTEDTIGKVVESANQTGIWKKSEAFNDFIKTHPYVYHRVKAVKYKELINLYQYIEDKTPYSTQHGIKGAEYDDVFIIMDNGNWFKYNFEILLKNLLSNGKNLNASHKGIFERTARLFYVCCSRSKNNLVVYYSQPTLQVLQTAKEVFGGAICVDNQFSSDITS